MVERLAQIIYFLERLAHIIGHRPIQSSKVRNSFQVWGQLLHRVGQVKRNKHFCKIQMVRNKFTM